MKKTVTKYYCDICKCEKGTHEIKSLSLPFVTNCNWNDGVSEAPHVEFEALDICLDCLIKSTNLRCGFQGQDMKLVEIETDRKNGEK